MTLRIHMAFEQILLQLPGKLVYVSINQLFHVRRNRQVGLIDLKLK